MSNALALFMRKELTCIPSLFFHVAERFNNLLGNLLFWSFMLWMIVHLLYDSFVDRMLRRMRYPEYIRDRMISNYWNFGFSFFTCIFCFVTLSNHDVDFTDLKSMHQYFVDKSDRYISSQYVLGFVVLSTFFLQTMFWEGNRRGYNKEEVYFNGTLVIFLFITYLKGWCEVQMGIVGLYSLTQTPLEIARTCSFQYQNVFFVKAMRNFWFSIHCVLCFLTYAFIIPLLFIIPCGRNMTDVIDFKMLIINTSMWSLYCFTLYQSVIFKMIKHYVYHMNGSTTECKLSFFECCMFPTRTDTAYGVRKVKEEIEKRQQMMHQQRNKPNKVALYQTLKVMVTMKRKLRAKRSFPDSDSSSSASSLSPSPSLEDISFDDNENGEDTMAVARKVVEDMMNKLDDESDSLLSNGEVVKEEKEAKIEEL